MTALVVGYGLVDGLGADPVTCWHGMLDQRDRSRPVTELDSGLASLGDVRGIWPESDWIETEAGSRHWSRTSRYAIHAAKQALAMSGLPRSPRVAVFVSNITGGREVLEESQRGRVAPKRLYQLAHDTAPFMVADYFGFKGPTLNVVNACSSSMVSIDIAMRYLDDYDYIMVGGSDAPLNQLELSAMISGRALGDSCRPFSPERTGTVLGNGAGCLVLQSESKSRQFGTQALARIYPVAMATDPDGLTLNTEIGIVDTMTKALNHVVDIQAVQAHATGTPKGDDVEHAAILRCCPDISIFSVKGKIGHTYGACGVLESIYALMSLQYQQLPASFNADTGMNNVNLQSQSRPMRRILKNTLGFGGRCASAVLELID